ncbi:hypothetical protein L7F22_034316 [Adiantum nelumboides]|nr:hypothetical protein [Adiantum nelumboides]
MEEHCCGIAFWLYLIIIVGLVLFAGLMSGLTLGLMFLGLVDLEVLLKSGTLEDQKHAAKILPVVKNQHLLLCTLLIGNSLAMEALPIFLDALVPSCGAILISVTLILMFGEILPQAVCSRYGLAVGAAMTPIVRVLVFLFFPITYPISKEEILDETDCYIDVCNKIKVNMLPTSSTFPVSSISTAAVSPLPSQTSSPITTLEHIKGRDSHLSSHMVAPRTTPQMGSSPSLSFPASPEMQAVDAIERSNSAT